jgi:hypothetical protein
MKQFQIFCYKMNSTEKKEELPLDLMGAFVLPAMCLYGMLMNLINVIVFSDKLYKSLNKMRIYLRALSTTMFTFQFLLLFSGLSHCGRFCSFSHSYLARWYDLVIFNYLSGTLYIMSCFIHFFTTLYAFCSFKKIKCSFFVNAEPRLVLGAFLIVSIIYTLPKVLIRQITCVQVVCSLEIVQTNQLYTSLSQYMFIGLRVLIVSLFILNVALLARLKWQIKNRWLPVNHARIRRTDVGAAIWTSFFYVSTHLFYTLATSIDAQNRSNPIRQRTYYHANLCFTSFLMGTYFFIFYSTKNIFKRIFLKKFLFH